MPSMSHKEFLSIVRKKVIDGGIMFSAASRETDLYFIHEVTFEDEIFQYIHEHRDLERGDFIKIPLNSSKKGHKWLVE